MRKVVLSLLVCFLLLAGMPAQAGVGHGRFWPPDTPTGQVDSQDSRLPPLAPLEPSTPAQRAVPLYTWRNLRPTEHLLLDVSMVKPGQVVNAEMYHGFAVGDKGVTLGYQNGVWDHVNRATDNMLWSVEVVSPTLAFACGNNGDIEQYGYRPAPIDGLVWQDLSVGGGFSGELRSISMGSDKEGWAVGVGGAMVKGLGTTHDAGGAVRYEWYTFDWSPVASVTDSDLIGVKMFSESEGWAVGGLYGTENKGTVVHYSGVTWTATDVGDWQLLAVDGVSANDVWAVGANGTIMHYGGSSWQSVDSPTTQHLRRVEMVSASEGWAAGDNGSLVHYTGGTWQLASDALHTDHDLSYRGMDFASGQGWMVGAWGMILKLRDDGDWVSVTSPTNNHLYSVWSLTYDDAWAVGAADDDGATILHWDGDVWERVYNPDMALPAAGLRTIEMVSDREGWTMGEPVGDPPSALTMRFDGVRWFQPLERSPSPNTIRSLDMVSSTLGWAVGDWNHSTVLYDRSVADRWDEYGTCTADIYDFQSVGVGISVTVPPTPAEPLEWDAWAAGIDYATGGGLDLCDEHNPQVWLHFEQCGSANRFNPTWNQYWWCGTGGRVNEIAFADSLHGYAAGNKDKSNEVAAQFWRYDGRTFQMSPTLQSDVWLIVGTDIGCSTGGYGPSTFNGDHSFWAGSPLTATLWIGGYGSCIHPYAGKSAWLAYYNQDGAGLFTWWGPYILPYAIIPPPGLWHRPVNDIRMVDETQGWAVGEYGDIFMYPFPNFALTVEPESRGVLPGGSAVYSIQAHGVISGSAFGITITPTLSAALLPHATMDLSSSSIQPNESASLAIAVDSNAPLGSHEVEVQGTTVLTSHDFVKTTLTRVDVSELYVTNNPIYSITPQRGPAGTSVTITGEGFGSSPGTVLFNGHNLPGSSIQSWNSTRIQIVMPDDVTIAPRGGVDGPIQVQVSDLSNSALFILEPHVTELDSDAVDVGDTIVINGTTFGPDPGVGNRNTGLYNVTLNDVPVPDSAIAGWSNNRITLAIPSGTTSGPVVVTSNGWQSNDDVLLDLGGMIYLPLVLRNY